MDEQNLQRLMMDQALGALNPDVQALLADYLKGRPESGELERWLKLARTAQEAMGHTAVERPPVMRFHSEPVFPLKRLALAALAMAAMVIATLLIRPVVQAPASSLSRGPIAVVQPLPGDAPAAPDATDFWSSRRILAAVMQPRRVHAGANWTWSDLQSSKGNIQ